MRRPPISLVILVFLAAGNGLAAPPTIKSISPGAIAPGRATEVTLTGDALDKAVSLWMSFEGQAEKLQCAEDRAVFKIVLPKDAAPGVGAIRLAATNGISSLRFIVIDSLPTTRASGTNHSAASAQQLKPPLAVEGSCEDRKSEFFKIPARKGETLAIDIVAQRAGSVLDPLARLFDPRGRELVFCEDTAGAGVDCRFDCKCASSGSYLLEMRDTRYDGGSQYRYRLRVATTPLEPLPMPFRARPEFIKSTGPYPQIEEIEPNDAKPQKISVPALVHGRFSRAKDQDRFQFEAKKGERLVFRSRTRSLGSPCDLYLRLETADGKKLGESPMLGAEESSLTNTFKDSGTFLLVVEEAAQLGGAEFFYLLQIEPFLPGFGLSIETEKVLGPPGGSAEIKVSPERHDYDGPITLALEGVPPGVTLEKSELTSKTNAMTVTIKLPADLNPGQLVNFRVLGRAKIAGNESIAYASTRPALRKLFPNLPWPPVELDGWMALGVTDK